MDKVPSIIEMSARSRERLCSTEVALFADPQWIGCIATWRKPTGRYAIELELPLACFGRVAIAPMHANASYQHADQEDMASVHETL